MPKSLLFIPDISGFTNFVQTTEVEHSQHVIAELLEVIISANTQKLALAEVEGDALFFYKESHIPSQEKLLAQVETMYTAFYSHLKLLEKHRICPCRACATAPELELKIIAHSGDLQFLEVQNNRKPFGEAVINAHRLLKNSISSHNYVLISKDLATDIGMPIDYESNLFCFRESVDTYDTNEIQYTFSEIETQKLKLKSFPEGTRVYLEGAPNLVFERTYPIDADKLMETITNYKYRHLWAEGVDEIQWNDKEVTRLGSEHICIIGGEQLNFTVVAKDQDSSELVYGELTTSPAPVDKLYQFYNIQRISDTKSKIRVELFWEAKSIFKKLIIALVAKKAFKKATNKALDKLQEIV